jgi:hypothetical protein
MDVSREAAARHTAERAAAAGGMVLLTRDQRPRAYELVASAGATAVAAGPATLGS